MCWQKSDGGVKKKNWVFYCYYVGGELLFFVAQGSWVLTLLSYSILLEPLPEPYVISLLRPFDPDNVEILISGE